MPDFPTVSVIVTELEGKVSAKAEFARSMGNALIGVYDAKEVLCDPGSKRSPVTRDDPLLLSKVRSPEGVVVIGNCAVAFEVLVGAIDAGIGALFDRALLLRPEWRAQLSKLANDKGVAHLLFCFPTRKNAYARRAIRSAVRSGKIGRVLAIDAINTTRELRASQHISRTELLNLWDYTEVFQDWVGPYRELYASGISKSAATGQEDAIRHLMVAGYLSSGALAVEYHSGASPLSRNHELITIYGTDGALRCDYAKTKAYFAKRDQDFEEITEEDCGTGLMPELAFAKLVAAHPGEVEVARESLLPLEDAISIARKLEEVETMVRNSPHSDLSGASQAGSIIDKLAWVHLVDGKCLVTRSKGKSLWYIPGGKREANENDVEALIREIREELRVELNPRSLSYLGAFHAQADGKPVGVNVKMTCYTGEILSGALEADNEIEEYDWFSFADIERVSKVDRLIFENLKEQSLIE